MNALIICLFCKKGFPKLIVGPSEVLNTGQWSFLSHYIYTFSGTGQMAQQLVAAPAEDLGSAPSLHTAVHSCLQLQDPMPFSSFQRHCMHVVGMQAKHPNKLK